jgi:ribosomal protein S18 acetylase RimI-like enzyme
MATASRPSRAFAAADELDLPRGVAFRHVRRPDDYRGMNRIVNEARASIGDPFTTTDAQLEAYYETPGRFVTDRDVAVVEQHGRMVGYVRCGLNAEVAGLHVYELLPFLDPAIDPNPIYPLMLEVIERHARRLAAEDPAEKVLETFGGDAAPHLERHVIAAGFAPVRHSYVMVRPHLDDLPDAPLPEGLEIRDVRPEDVRTIYDAAVLAFSDAWGATEQTDEDWERFRTDPLAMQTDLWRVAWDGDRVAGQVRSFISDEENRRFGRLRGYTESISVGRPWRRRGLARALIAASFPLLRARGMTEAALGVDTENVTGALRVYERCGFVPVSRTTTFRKPFD